MRQRDIGLKLLTVDNWPTPDPLSVKMLANMPPDPFAEEILSATLADEVPDDVCNLFLVAQGSILYGYFSYPLYAIGVEQLYRVLEAAVSHKCKLMGRIDKNSNFDQKIKWLIKNGVIRNEEKDDWDSIRKARNLVSHLDRQMIVPPAMVINAPKVIARRINSL